MSEKKEASKSTIEEQLQKNGVYVSTTSGWSMKPMLRDRRDRIVLLPVGDRELKKWDLPMYRRPDGKYVLHRIIGVREDHYIIRGDNTYQKERVPKEWVLGYVSEFYRGDRHVKADSRSYRFYAATWNLIYPIRRVWWGIREVLSKIKHKMFK